MGKHEIALQHSMKALILIQDELTARMSMTGGGEANAAEARKLKSNEERIIVLCIAYHNIAVEQEFLKQYNACLRSYRKAVDCARKYLGEGHPMTNNLEDVYESATKKIAESIEKNVNRKTKGQGIKNIAEIEALLMQGELE